MKQAYRLVMAVIMTGTVLWQLTAFGTEALAAATAPPAPGTIEVVNRLAGTADTITVFGLIAGDEVKVYSDPVTAGSLIGSATVPPGQTHAVVSVNQLGEGAGVVYVTVTRPSNSESRRILKSYASEPVAVPPPAASIRVANHNEGISDLVRVSGLAPGDTVRVYSASAGGSPVGTATALPGTDTAEVSIGQLGPGEGLIYVSVQTAGKRESRRTEKSVRSEPQTPALQIQQLQLSPGLDKLSVTGLQPGDVVKLYASEHAASPDSVISVPAGASTANVPLSSLNSGGGKLFVSLTRAPLLESGRLSKLYGPEAATHRLSPGQIQLLPGAGDSSESLVVSGLTQGQTVRVYAEPALQTLLAEASVASGDTGVNLRFSSQSVPAGIVYVTLTNPGVKESEPVTKMLPNAPATPPPDRSLIRIANRAGLPDLITVDGLQPGDRIRVYAELSSQTPLAETVVSGERAQLEIAQLGADYGIVYLSAVRGAQAESVRIPKVYAAEPRTPEPSAARIHIMNRAAGSGMTDEVAVGGLKPGDEVRLYADRTAPEVMRTLNGDAAAAIVASGETSVTIRQLQLLPEGGRLYVTVTSQGQRESLKVGKLYDAE
ncbi:hypothetical protein O9H85_22565 [Paenibacillus filicis]|uniref:Uncharacterized protein n=1 Tax=Paenibacillus gyeongsangnamensis TaxID=3388067 RepID=A0ABT4QEF6_9BACL|nr:hypothetical protein [Paenibacillus filicis]MCZ8515151.1 hypothetical protein [Paenibacillus filicis]